MNGSWTNWKISPSPSEKNLPLLEERKNVSFGARDFCRQRATRCENVTQYYQAADTMIGCLLPRDGIWVPKIGYCYPKNTLTFGFGFFVMGSRFLPPKSNKMGQHDSI